MNNQVKYSLILQEFIRPLLNDADSDEVFLQKVAFGKVAWNYCIAKEFQLPVFPELNKIVVAECKKQSETSLVFDFLIKRKNSDFNRYKNFIYKTEFNKNNGNEEMLFVASIEPTQLKKEMSKLGSKNKPARVRVQTEERAYELMALCNQKNWEVIVGIEPDKPENIDDIKKLQAGSQPDFKFKSSPARNAPCSCGSGKLYKRCCGR